MPTLRAPLTSAYFRSLPLILCATVLFSTSDASSNPQEAKSLVTESKASLTQAGTTGKISIKIKRPRAPKGSTLDKGIQIKGCWLGDNFKSLSAKDASNKKVKFKTSKDGSTLEFKKVRAIKFPVKAVLNFKNPVLLEPGASRVSVIGQTNCTTIKKKNGTTKRNCSEVQPISLYGTFSGALCSTPSDIEERGSSAAVVFADGDEFMIRSRNEPLRFALTAGSFASNLSDATIIVNDNVFTAPDVKLEGGLLTLSAMLADGLNKVSVLAIDSTGLQARGSFSFWAGSNTLSVLFRDSAGQVVESGIFTLKIADDPAFFRTLNFSGGQINVENLPGTTIALSATATDGQSGFSAGAGSDVTATVTMLPLMEESNITNNDISAGTEGWNIGDGSPVSVIPHSEGEPSVLLAGAQNAAEPPDQDLVLRTSGEGPRFISRTFRTDPRSRLVKIRYRFQTSEYPGGYFGSKYNDFYNVSLRSSHGASILDDGSSMNALGRPAFSPAGYTVWKSTVIPVNRNQASQASGEVVQASVVVANVADGAYDSRVIVDKIEESSFAITQAELLDIDNSKLSYLSADAHNYFDGFTRINGTITLEGEEADKITEIYLQLMDGNTQLGRAELSTQAASKLLNKKFGKSGKISLKTPILLFKIFPSVLSGLNSTEDRGFSLVIQAKTAKGQTAHTSLGSVKQLVRFDGTARYDGRDEASGGDDWVLPSLRTVANQLSGVTWGDFSNMNGGGFPPHSLHRDARSADGWVAGYNQLNAETAESLISLLNSAAGNRIHFIYARFNRSPGNAFWQAISGRHLNNGRPVDRVILPDGEHGTHFHVEF